MPDDLVRKDLMRIEYSTNINPQRLERSFGRSNQVLVGYEAKPLLISGVLVAVGHLADRLVVEQQPSRGEVVHWLTIHPSSCLPPGPYTIAFRSSSQRKMDSSVCIRIPSDDGTD